MKKEDFLYSLFDVCPDTFCTLNKEINGNSIEYTGKKLFFQIFFEKVDTITVRCYFSIGPVNNKIYISVEEKIKAEGIDESKIVLALVKSFHGTYLQSKDFLSWKDKTPQDILSKDINKYLFWL